MNQPDLTLNRPTEDDATARIPYRHPQPQDAFADIVIPHAVPEDERLWVPQATNVWFRPLCLSASRGYWVNLLRVRTSGVLSRHRHPQPHHHHQQSPSTMGKAPVTIQSVTLSAARGWGR